MTATSHHELVVGRPSPDRVAVVAKLVVPSSWLIDVNSVHPDNVADWTARDLPAARDMLASLNRALLRQGNGMCVTIEDATPTLRDPQVRANLEDILRGQATSGIKFRLVVERSDVDGFGGSKVIREAISAGNVIEVHSHG